jgi:spore germination protein GerM
MARRIVAAVLVAALVLAGGWWLIGRWARRGADVPAAVTTATAPAVDARKITVTLYYVSEDGMELVGVPREIPFGETVLEQARHLVSAQLEATPPPLISAIPAGTALRAIYLTDAGEAFVDLSADARTAHTGGALDELFTVYTIVNALTTNLPAVARVQILIEGKEVDTLAGHVDLRHPLQKNLKWVRTEKGDS